MQDIILNQVSAIRLGAAALVMLIIAVWELAAPEQPLQLSKGMRWLNNLGLALINTLVIRLIFPLAAVAAAIWAQAQGYGLLNQFQIHGGLTALLAIVLMDLAIWGQHVLMHAVPWLWRLHRVHHADPDFDLSTGSRFHPLEMIFSMLLKMIVIVLIGPAASTVVVFEILLNAMAVFNHGNIRLPKWIEKPLRWLIVTPAMHRVHHSQNPLETNSNYGFSLSIWDHLFNTHHISPSHASVIKIGIREFQAKSDVSSIPGMLTLPFKSPASAPLH
jgi:sterol desaturase/sphingolipid hydroxylase (fatty acid hydroxylase superfamily)